MAIIIAVIVAVIVIALLITFNVREHFCRTECQRRKERSDRHYSRTAGKA